MRRSQEQSLHKAGANINLLSQQVSHTQEFDPANLSYTSAQKYLPSTYAAVNFEKEILDLIEHNDFWQGALRYVGPLPAPGPAYDAAMDVLHKSFAPIMKLREVLRRHVRGVIGREPLFEIVFPEITEPKRKRLKRENYQGSRSEIEALADEADRVQGETWDERGEHSICGTFLRRLRATGRAYFRYDVPPGLRVEGIDREAGDDSSDPVIGVSADNWQEAYGLFYLELAPRGSAAVYTDPATMKKTSFFSYDEPKPKGKGRRKCIQMSWIAEEGEGAQKVKMTHVRVVRNDKSAPEQWKLDTGGRLLVIEATMEPLLTPDLLRLQDIASSAGTMIKINDDVAGFPQETAIDLKTPTKLVDDPDKPGQKKHVDVPMAKGPRTMQFHYSYVDKDNDGNPIKDEKGAPAVRSGSIHFRQPVNSAGLREDAEWFIKEIYLQTHQEHIVARRSAVASADMLVEMRADYADSLLETKPHLERVLREVFHARLCAAAYIAGDTDTLAKFKAGRVRVDAQLNAGPLSTGERAEILNRKKEGLLSEQTAAIMLGTEDWDAEKAQIEEEANEKLGDGGRVKVASPPVKKTEAPSGE